MIESIKYLFISFLSGLTAIIPGVSGGTIFAIFNLSEKLSTDINSLMHGILNFRKISIIKVISQHWKLPTFIGLGSLVSSILYANILVNYGSEYIYFISFFFIGLVVFSLPTLWRETSYEEGRNNIRYLYLIIGFLISLIIFLYDNALIGISSDYTSFWFMFKFFIISFVGGITTILPGISGTNILILGGVFEPYLLFSSNVVAYLPQYLIYLIATILGTIVAAKFFTILFKYFRRSFFSIMTGLTASTIVFIWINPFVSISTFSESLIGFICAYLIIKLLAKR